jgi:DNA-binding transcriptional regulator YiaG
MRTNDETRRLNMMLAIPRTAIKGKSGTQARLAELIATAPAYLSQIKNRVADSKSGTPKAMGDELARRIESAINVPAGWMDTEQPEEWAKAGLIAREASDTPDQAVVREDLSIEAWKHRLLLARRTKGLSVADLASAVLTSSPTVVEWERRTAEGAHARLLSARLLPCKITQ